MREARRRPLLRRDRQGHALHHQGRHHCRRRRFVPAAHTEGAGDRSVPGHAALLSGQGSGAVSRQEPRDRRRRRFGARLGARLRRQGRKRRAVHRRDGFRAAPASVAKMKDMCERLEMQFLVGQVTGFDEAAGRLAEVRVTSLDGADAPRAARCAAGVLRPVTQARADRTMGPRPRAQADRGGHREVRDQRSRHLRGGRHQYLPRQEETDPLGLPRGRPRRVRRRRSTSSPSARSTCSTRRPARSCTRSSASNRRCSTDSLGSARATDTATISVGPRRAHEVEAVRRLGGAQPVE